MAGDPYPTFQTFPHRPRVKHYANDYDHSHTQPTAMNGVYTFSEEETQHQPQPQPHEPNRIRTTKSDTLFQNDTNLQSVQRREGSHVKSREVSTTLDSNGQIQQQEISEKQQIQARERDEDSGLKLRLDLNLDIEVELKAKISGDLTLALLYVWSLYLPLFRLVLSRPDMVI
ncbi:hypothetical protein BDV12DRAFT_203153 [Aspergillus spectabilis]